MPWRCDSCLRLHRQRAREFRPAALRHPPVPARPRAPGYARRLAQPRAARHSRHPRHRAGPCGRPPAARPGRSAHGSPRARGRAPVTARCGGRAPGPAGSKRPRMPCNADGKIPKARSLALSGKSSVKGAATQGAATPLTSSRPGHRPGPRSASSAAAAPKPPSRRARQLPPPCPGAGGRRQSGGCRRAAITPRRRRRRAPRRRGPPIAPCGAPPPSPLPQPPPNPSPVTRHSSPRHPPGPVITYVSAMNWDLANPTPQVITAMVDATGRGAADYTFPITDATTFEGAALPNGIAWCVELGRPALRGRARCAGAPGLLSHARERRPLRGRPGPHAPPPPAGRRPRAYRAAPSPRHPPPAGTRTTCTLRS